MMSEMMSMGLFLFRKIYKDFYEKIYCTLCAEKKEVSVMMTLREVCNKIGVSRRAIQGYEEVGLVLSSGKNKYGHLLYDDLAVEKIQCIKQYQDFGFKVNEITKLLEVADDVYVEMMSKQVDKMKVQLKGLQSNIELAEKMIVERQAVRN